MIKILFVCYGNICRSPMAEFILKDLIKKNNIKKDIIIESAATSYEEIGNPIYYATKDILNKHNIFCEGKIARKLLKEDYEKYDYIIGMDDNNIHTMNKIFEINGSDKIFKLLDFTELKKDIEDPWHTRNFDIAYNEILLGCKGLLNYLELL